MNTKQTKIILQIIFVFMIDNQFANAQTKLQTIIKPKLLCKSQNISLIYKKKEDLLQKEILPEANWQHSTPLLPMTWPPISTPQHAIVSTIFVFYTSDALPTGVVKYIIKGPNYQMKVNLFSSDSSLSLEKIKKPKVLGTKEENFQELPTDFSNQLRKAEQVLLDIVVGCRDAESARPELQPYLIWLEHNSLISKDLAKRTSFVKWIQSNHK